jgi:TrmH family RNA methyltransferase
VVAAAKLLRHVGRKRAGLFLAEGPKRVSEDFATEGASPRFDSMLTDAPVHLVTERAAKALSETVTPVGLIAVCSLPELTLDDVLSRQPRLVAVAVEISEPGNAGTLIRVSDAMGADAVVLAGNSVDPYNGKCLRASAGSIFSIPVVSETDAPSAVAALRATGLRVLATTVDGEVTLDEADLAAPTAWLFGPEAHGLAAELAAAASHRVRIAMPGNAESLNVASAAAICMYQSAQAHRA